VAYKLITSNLRLVIKIALEFQKYWMKNLLDLIQEGNIGLMQAIKKFDPYRGIKLSYYASFWIKAYILKFIMDNWKLVKIGTTQAQRKLFYNLKREKEKLRAQGFEPGPKLLSDVLHVREEEVVEMEQRLGAWELSLDAPLREGSEDYHKNFLPAYEPQVEEILADAELKGMFRQKLAEFRKTLSDKELDILDSRLLAEKGLTLQEIGARHGVSRERVRQIEDRLIKKLRHYLQSEIPDWEEHRSSVLD
jgi:RNA polymerase sigma-32 factor